LAGVRQPATVVRRRTCGVFADPEPIGGLFSSTWRFFLPAFRAAYLHRCVCIIFCCAHSLRSVLSCAAFQQDGRGDASFRLVSWTTRRAGLRQRWAACLPYLPSSAASTSAFLPIAQNGGFLSGDAVGRDFLRCLKRGSGLRRRWTASRNARTLRGRSTTPRAFRYALRLYLCLLSAGWPSTPAPGTARNGTTTLLEDAHARAVRVTSPRRRGWGLPSGS